MKKQSIEWPTTALLGLVYLLFVSLTLTYYWLPWWLILPLGGSVIALHGSLQHEVIHGHPTRWRKLNEAMVFPALSLWLPYALYRDSHLQHHHNDLITDPFDDPESYYVSAAQWHKMNKPVRGLYWLRNTLFGRLLIGPLWIVTSFLLSEIRHCLNGNAYRLKVWSYHLVSVLAVLWWIKYCQIPLVEYVLFIVYPGLALTLLRSFLEHKAEILPEHRTVVINSGAIFSLLFLNNNLHALHHEQPGLPWYHLPREWNKNKTDILSRNGGYYYDGYRSLFMKYLFLPKTHPRHPEK